MQVQLTIIPRQPGKALSVLVVLGGVFYSIKEETMVFHFLVLNLNKHINLNKDISYFAFGFQSPADAMKQTLVAQIVEKLGFLVQLMNSNVNVIVNVIQCQ